METTSELLALRYITRQMFDLVSFGYNLFVFQIKAFAL